MRGPMGTAVFKNVGRDGISGFALLCISSLTVLIIILIIAFTAFNGMGILEETGLTDFLFGTDWSPSSGEYGALPMITGTILVTLGAMVFAFPLGLGAAVYISEIASPGMRGILKPLCEIFSGIPSVVYGFFGLVVLVPLLSDLLPEQMMFGSSWLAGSILLGIMALPTVISVSEDAIHSVPGSYREASLALGATRWETISRIVVPAAVSGISSALILGIGRAIGETMAVMMVTGNATIIPDPLWNVFSLISTMTGILALEMPEVVVGSMHYSALFMLGLVLMVMVLMVNMASRSIVNRTRRKFGYGDEKDGLWKRMTGGADIIPANLRVFIERNRGTLLESGLYILTFVGLWMFSSLLFGDVEGLILAALGVALVHSMRRLTGSVDSTCRQRMAETALKGIMVLVMGILVVILGYILIRGLPALDWEFLTAAPTDGGKSGGIMPAIVGTLELLAGTAAIALPLGLLTGIYLAEYAKDTHVTRIIREAIDILNGTPSIVFGLFGLSFLVIFMGFGYSMIAGWFALAFMILPVVIRTTEEAIRTVPNELREASRALGATKWQTIVKVVVPAAMGGITTGSILSLGRAAGETAPIMFTAVVAFQPHLAGSVFEPVMALPYHLYYLAAEVPGATDMQFGCAAVLLIIVLLMFGAASLIRNHYNKKVKW